MGKKVFEVAKDLGVDHRELLKKCDSLNIDVRNYMSVLTDDQEKQLRGTFETGGKVVERVQAPGVVRRRRAAKPARDARPVGLKPRPVIPSLKKPVVPEPKVAEPAAETAPEPAPSVKAEVVEPTPAAATTEVSAAPAAAAPVSEAAAPAGAEKAVETAAAAPAQVAEPVKAPEVQPKAKVASLIRKPTSAGGAKVLGFIPIEQL
jgi:translation initiation factor IF-2